MFSQRNQYTTHLANPEKFVGQAKIWGGQFSHFVVLDSQGHKDKYREFDIAIATGCKHEYKPNGKDDFSGIFEFHQKHKDWIFGHLGYDLKNQIENLNSRPENLTGFADISFFIPEIIIFITNGEAKVYCHNSKNGTKVIEDISSTTIEQQNARVSQVSPTITRDHYINTVHQLKELIRTGEIYEVNFCQQFTCELLEGDFYSIANRLAQESPTPFSAYYKINQSYMACASPERFMRKIGSKLISQPIKGTITRGNSAVEDQDNVKLLQNNTKEIAENVMIVDLVRNDLSRVSIPGTVQVDELMGIYSFAQVHQMISTVSGNLSAKANWAQAIKAAFPMGSMTGAPKVRAMEIIDEYESQRRGLFSGAVGYVTEQGDFDFNVIIRSIFYNQQTKQLSFQAGGAITYDALPESEYNETLLKVSAIKSILEKA